MDSGTAASSRPAEAGILTAGDYDDLLNPGPYMTYANGYFAQGRGVLPMVNTAEAVTVEVTDRDGDPVPFARVAVRRGDDAALVLTTAANGRAVLYPDHDRLPERFTIEVFAPGAPSSPEVRVERALSRGETIPIRLAGNARPVRKLDLVLVIDTTGSMGDELNYLKAELDAIVGNLSSRHPGIDIRLGLVFYRDTTDQYVVRSYPFSGRVELVKGALSRQFASGGGDYPEAMDQAMVQAVGGYAWREDSANVLLLVADAPPHQEGVEETWRSAIEARRRRVHITPVAASGVADEAEFLMRSMAALTQSRYLFLTDDSGVGNAHAAPSVDCYLVTRLNGLIERTIDSLISGRRVEPSEQDVIRTVGNYDKGVCLAPKP